MELIKNCPACGEENPVSEVICRRCMTNIASVSPSAERPRLARSEGGYSADRSGEPVTMTLSRVSDGRRLTLESGTTLGRSGETEEFFKDAMTVSRTHARICLDGGVWRVEDMGSLNGTWVNGKRVEPGQSCPLAAGDILALSLACEMRVIG